MKTLINFLILLSLLFTSLNGAGVNVNATPVDSITVDNMDVHISYPKSTDKCEIQYPTINKDFLDIRLKKIDLAKGLFEYYVYFEDHTIIKSDIFWISQACKDKYTTLKKDEKKELEKRLQSIDFVDEKRVEKEAGDTIDKMEQKFFAKNYNNTTTQEYINTSEYLIAVLTMNHEIIDIDASIMHGSIILNPEYRLGDNRLTEALNLNFFTFIFDWVTKSDSIFRQLQMVLLTFFVPFSIAILSLSKVSRKIQKLYDQEDLIERGIIGVIIFSIFVISPHRFEDKEKNLAYAQSTFQSQIGSISKIGVNYANDITNTLTSSYVGKLKKDIGVSSKDEVERVMAHSLKLEKELSTYETLQKKCYENKNPESLHEEGFRADEITTFPTSEDSNFNEKIYFLKWDDPATDLKYTLSFCRNVDILKNNIERTLKRNNEFIETVQKSSGNTTIDDFAATAKEMMRASADYGFLYSPFIMFNKIFIENYGLMKPLNDTNQIERGADESWFGVNKLMYTAPLYAAPGVESTLKVYKDLDISQGLKKIAGKFLDGLPVVGKGLGGSVDYALDKAGYVLVMGMMAKVYEYLPLLGITVASILAISYFGITLFIYGLISPFYAVYVFSTQQKESIISFLIRGVVIMFKPILIVISIIIAILAVELMTNLGYIISNEVFTFFTNNNIVSRHSLSSMIISFLHGLVDLVLAIATTLFAFYFVFKGSDLILSVFGYKEGGIDSHEVVNEIEQKASNRAIGV